MGDNIKMNSKEMEWEGFDWVNLSQDRYRWQAVVNALMNLQFA
jgi:hypothetical protein